MKIKQDGVLQKSNQEIEIRQSMPRIFGIYIFQSHSSHVKVQLITPLKVDMHAIVKANVDVDVLSLCAKKYKFSPHRYHDFYMKYFLG